MDCHLSFRLSSRVNSPVAVVSVISVLVAENVLPSRSLL
jgi:hypothetical protein